MPILTVQPPEADTPMTFFYTDSGSPQCQIYTTLVVLHGLLFHSGTFSRILPLAASKGLRVVCINRRDYTGSTLYTTEEMKVISDGTEEKRAVFLNARGVEIALFLDSLIDALGLPEPTEDGADGGLGLMGWSLGSLFTVCTIASAASLPSHIQTRLKSYLRRLIIFDSPTTALGIPNAPRAYIPFFDEEIPLDQRMPTFSRWVASYFSHGDISTRDVTTLEFKDIDQTRKSQIAAMPNEELSPLVDFGPPHRSDIPILTFPEHLKYSQTLKGLFDAENRRRWPNMGIWVLYCDCSPGTTVHAGFELEKLAKANEETPVQVHLLEDAHHAVFWDEPERALKAFDHCLKN